MEHLTTCRLASAAVAALLCSLAVAAAPVTVYVSPTGIDTASGAKGAPVGTVGRAMELARAQRGDDRAGYRIILRAGTYYLSQTVQLGPQDSGTAQAPTEIRAAPGESVRLVAGRRLTGWQPWQGNILQLDLKTQGLAGAVFRQLFCDRQRQAMARTPNCDATDPHNGRWAYVEAAVEPGSSKVFRFAPGDMKAWADMSQAEVFLYHSYNYYNTIVPLASVDLDQRVARLGKDTYNEIKGEGAERYYVQNVLEELDAPGEWVLDRKTSVVYFYPPAGPGAHDAPPAGLQGSAGVPPALVEVPLHEHVVHLTPGTEYVTVRGLTLEVSEGGAVQANEASHCRIIGCRVGHCGVGGEIGGWGPWEDQCGIGLFGGQDNGAVGNDIYDTGGHGVKLTGGDRKTLTPAGNFATNNHIRHTGVYWAQGCGARLEGVGNRFARNTVHDCPRMGVIFGGNDNVIEYNDLYDLNRETCDTGAIYTGGRDWLTPWGSRIQYNYIHDIGGYGRKDGKWVSPEFSWGIYLDDNSNGCNVIGNIVVGGYLGGVHLHNAHDSLIENNVIVNSVKQQVHMNGWVQGSGIWANSLANWTKMWEEYKQYPAWRKYPGFVETDPADLVPMSGNRFLRNIFYATDAKLPLYTHRALPLAQSVFDYNLVWHGGASPGVGVQNAVKVQVPPDAVEMIVNGSFEEGTLGQMPASWEWMMRPAGATAVLSEEAAHTGQRCLRIDPKADKDAAGNPQATFVRTKEFAVQSGRGYQLRVWAKGDQPGRTLGLVAQSYKGGQHHWAREQTFTLGTDWQEVSLDFMIPGPHEADFIPTLDNLWIRLDCRQGEGTVWVDDVSLKMGTNPLESQTQWQMWQGLGQDVHSVLADPQFVAPEQSDFRLKPTSPALKLGFRPIAVEKIGCYRSPERASWPLDGARE